MRGVILMLVVGGCLLSGRAQAQTAPGDFSGQSTIGPAYVTPDYQICRIGVNGDPATGTQATYIVTSGFCSSDQLSQGGQNLLQNGTNVVTQNTLPASASQSVGLLVGGIYNDPRFPDAVYSQFGGTLPLSSFATAKSVSALGGALVNESNAREADIARVSSQFRLATATAVALGGNGFIPGKRLNLTLNYGSYEGESAMSLQGAFIVNSNAYVNMGLASGISGSGTAFRTGLTLGW
jgi:hypothetical protein